MAGQLGLDGVGARLGDGEAQVGAALLVEERVGGDERADHEPGHGHDLGAGGELQLHHLAGRGRLQASPAPARSPHAATASSSGSSTIGKTGEQAGDLEHLQDAGLGAHQGEVAVVGADPLERRDEHAEAGGVDEVDPLEVDHDPVASGR